MEPMPLNHITRLTLALLLGLLLLTAAPLSAAEKAAAEKTTAQTATATGEPAAAPTIAPLIDLKTLLKPAVDEDGEPIPESSFGTRLLDWLAATGKQFGLGVDKYVGNIADLPQLSKWFEQQTTVPRLIERWQMIGQQLGAIVLFGTLAALALHFLLTPMRRKFRDRQPRHFLHKCALNGIQLGLGLLPIIFFIVVTLYLLGIFVPPLLVRLVILSIVYAVVLAQIALLLGQFILAPRAPPLRLLPCTDARAKNLYGWLRALTYLIVYGYFFAEAARLLNVPAGPRAAFTNLLGFSALIVAIALVRAQRDAVADWLRHGVDANPGDLIGWARLNLAGSWHRLTIIYLLIGYSVTSLNAEGSFIALLRGTLVTVGVFLGINLILYGLNQRAQRAAQVAIDGSRLPLHQPVMLAMLRLGTLIGGVGLVLFGWNVDLEVWFKSELGQKLYSAVASITVTVIAAIGVYEIICAITGSQLRRRAYGPMSFDRQARMRTLSPLIRHSAAIILSAVVIMVGLTELGVNIAPLLAGAGIIGVAVGFGSQALVKDVITGLFNIIEDTIHVGDIVACGVHNGTVESMSIRTMRLRDVEGALHILPYSEVTGLINKTRGFAYAVIDVGVAYHTDIPAALKIMEQTGIALQKDPVLGLQIMAAPEMVAGILAFGDSAITLRCRIKTLPGKQWDVRFAYQLQLKTAFEQAGIMIPFPTVTHHVMSDNTPVSPPQLSSRPTTVPRPPLDDERDN
jgi:small conductance mechanosensitive channel